MMPGKKSFYHKILVPLDGSELAEYVLRPVGEIVRGCEVNEVVFLRVTEPFRTIIPDEYVVSGEQATSFTQLLKEDAQKYLNDVVSRVRYAVQTEVIVGNPAQVIVDYASDNGVDLIVMSTHGRSGVSRWVWGSVTDKVLHASCVPVFLVRAPGCVPKSVNNRSPAIPESDR